MNYVDEFKRISRQIKKIGKEEEEPTSDVADFLKGIFNEKK